MLSVFDVFDNCIFFNLLKKSFTEPKAEGQSERKRLVLLS